MCFAFDFHHHHIENFCLMLNDLQREMNFPLFLLYTCTHLTDLALIYVYRHASMCMCVCWSGMRQRVFERSMKRRKIKAMKAYERDWYVNLLEYGATLSSDHRCNAIWRIWTRISNEMNIHLSILKDNENEDIQREDDCLKMNLRKAKD